MKVEKVRMWFDYIDVYFEDGRAVRILGEMLVDGFVAFKDSIEKWKTPEGEPISESEKKEIVEAVEAEAKGWKTRVVFE